jgi:hypothetical protein
MSAMPQCPDLFAVAFPIPKSFATSASFAVNLGFPITRSPDHPIFLQPSACISQPETPPGY